MTIATLLALFTTGLLIGGCQRQPPEPGSPPPPPSAPPVTEEPTAPEPVRASEQVGVVEVNSDNFEPEVLNAETLVVVGFWAEWCGPCKALKPTLDELASEYAGRVKFASVDTDENPSLARKYGIRAIPCLIFFRDGEEIHRVIGLQPKEDLKSEIDKLLAE